MPTLRSLVGRRTPLTLVLAAAVVVAVGLVADLLVPPARAALPLTLYVDVRIGADSHDGRRPDRALETLDEAVRQARPGADILLTGYGTRLDYPGTGTRCLTVVGTADRPVVIRRNVYTNTLNPAVLSVDRKVTGRWTPHGGERADGSRTWSTPWPRRIRLTGDPDLGFVKIGGIALTGHARRPVASEVEAAWWAGGKVFVRTARADPRKYPVVVKDGDGICLSARSRHVRVKDLMVVGAVHAVRVEPGAVDVEVEHLVRQNVLDDDFVPASAAGGRGRGQVGDR